MSTPTPGAAPQMAAEQPLLKLPLKAQCFQAEDADGVPVFHCGLGLRPPSESVKQEARCAHIVHCVNTHAATVEALDRILLRAVRQQAKGGDVMAFQDALWECADIARAAKAGAQ